MTSPTLTVAIIALNEAPRLCRLLPQLDFADEVLIVDGGSSDDTVRLACAAGATVVERRFDHFAAQRNAALQAAQGAWIFYIDADERPTPALIDEIGRRLSQSTAGGFRVPIRSTIFGRRFRFSGTQNDVPLRLVRRGSGQWVGAVHETFVAGGGVEQLEYHLLHDTLPTTDAFQSKMRRYTQIEARDRLARDIAPNFSDRWLRPPREFFRRLIWKQGWLDGPAGWLFCALSAKSEWVLASEHRRLWREANIARGEPTAAPRLAAEGGSA